MATQFPPNPTSTHKEEASGEPISTQQIQRILDENVTMIHRLMELQQKGLTNEAGPLQHTLHENLVRLATIADKTTNATSGQQSMNTSSNPQAQLMRGPYPPQGQPLAQAPPTDTAPPSGFSNSGMRPIGPPYGAQSGRPDNSIQPQAGPPVSHPGSQYTNFSGPIPSGAPGMYSSGPSQPNFSGPPAAPAPTQPPYSGPQTLPIPSQGPYTGPQISSGPAQPPYSAPSAAPHGSGFPTNYQPPQAQMYSQGPLPHQTGSQMYPSGLSAPQTYPAPTPPSSAPQQPPTSESPAMSQPPATAS